jgi:hypothetical protein
LAVIKVWRRSIIFLSRARCRCGDWSPETDMRLELLLLDQRSIKPTKVTQTAMRSVEENLVALKNRIVMWKSGCVA